MSHSTLIKEISKVIELELNNNKIPRELVIKLNLIDKSSVPFNQYIGVSSHLKSQSHMTSNVTNNITNITFIYKK